MAQQETEHLTRILTGAALRRAVSTIAELGGCRSHPRGPSAGGGESCPGGQERTEAQFGSLLKAAGFELKFITPTTSMVSVVEGRPV